MSQKCRECGGPLPNHPVKAYLGKHPDPGDYCTNDCALNAFIRKRAYFASLYPAQFPEDEHDHPACR